MAQTAEKLRCSESLLEECRAEAQEAQARVVALQKEAAAQREEKLAIALKLQYGEMMVAEREAKLRELEACMEVQSKEAAGVGAGRREELIEAAEKALEALDRVQAEKQEMHDVLTAYVSENSRLRERLQHRRSRPLATPEAAHSPAGRSRRGKDCVSDCERERGSERHQEGGSQRPTSPACTAESTSPLTAPGLNGFRRSMRSQARHQGGVVAGRAVGVVRRALHVHAAASNQPCSRTGDSLSPRASGRSSSPSSASSPSLKSSSSSMIARSSPRWK